MKESGTSHLNGLSPPNMIERNEADEMQMCPMSRGSRLCLRR